MMYPFITLDDDTEIVHSEMREDGTVKVYMEKPVEGGFHSATCILPKYEWSGIEGYSENEIERYADVIRSAAHLIIKYAQHGGYANAANYIHPKSVLVCPRCGAVSDERPDSRTNEVFAALMGSPEVSNR